MEDMRLHLKVGSFEMEASGSAEFIDRQRQKFIELLLGAQQEEIVPKIDESVSEGQEVRDQQVQDNVNEAREAAVVGAEKKNRKRIDYGKIMALRNAGWSNKQIAEEMDMTPGNVAVAISTYKKKKGIS